MAGRKTEFRVNVGTSSILMIFVILCLVSFATLSIVSSNADWRLSRKVAERTSAYYGACNDAYSTLAQLDASLQEIYLDAGDEASYFEAAGQSRELLFPLSDMQALQVNLEILHPSQGEGFYRITSWQVILTQEPEYNNSFNVLP